MKSRAYSNMDYKGVKDFLNRVYEINRNQHSWLPQRWEYAEYFVSPLNTILGNKNWISSMRLWINDNLEIVGIVNSEDPDHKAFLQIHPDYRFIEEEMIKWAEDNISLEKDTSEYKQLSLYCHEGDKHREDILKRRGFEKSEKFEFLKWQTLEHDIENVNIPDEYSIHSFEEETRVEQKIVCITKSFHPSDECREEDIDLEDLSIFANLQNAPMYRKDLDIYIQYKDEAIAATALVWYDPISNVGVFEPVATHPEHQGKGLGKAIVLEGLKRLKALEAKTAYVGTHGIKQSQFYESVGFMEYDKYREWIKIII